MMELIKSCVNNISPHFSPPIIYANNQKNNPTTTNHLIIMHALYVRIWGLVGREEQSSDWRPLDLFSLLEFL